MHFLLNLFLFFKSLSLSFKVFLFFLFSFAFFFKNFFSLLSLSSCFLFVCLVFFVHSLVCLLICLFLRWFFLSVFCLLLLFLWFFLWIFFFFCIGKVPTPPRGTSTSSIPTPLLPPVPPSTLPTLQPTPVSSCPFLPHFQLLATASYRGGPAVGCVGVDRVLVLFLDTVVNLEETVIPVGVVGGGGGGGCLQRVPGQGVHRDLC